MLDHSDLRKEMGHRRDFNVLGNILFLAWTVDKFTVFTPYAYSIHIFILTAHLSLKIVKVV